MSRPTVRSVVVVAAAAVVTVLLAMVIVLVVSLGQARQKSEDRAVAAEKTAGAALATRDQTARASSRRIDQFLCQIAILQSQITEDAAEQADLEARITALQEQVTRAGLDPIVPTPPIHVPPAVFETPPCTGGSTP